MTRDHQRGPTWSDPHQVRCYRLINDRFEPHAELDGLYASVEEALADASQWLLQRTHLEGERRIGVEVCTSRGAWRTCRLPLPVQHDLTAGTPPDGGR